MNQSVRTLIESLPGLARTFSSAIAVRFVEIAVRYRRADRENDQTLDFAISDQNTCSLLSVTDPFERLLGHRLLRAWNLLVDGQTPGEADLQKLILAILPLWELGFEKVAGAWLIERKLDVQALVRFGFLVPLGWEDTDLIEDDVSVRQQEVLVEPRPEGIELVAVDGRSFASSHSDSYRVYRVRHEWVAEYLKLNVVSQFGVKSVEVISSDLLVLGTIEIDQQSVPVYLARRLHDERIYADIDTALRLRSNLGIGLVLNAGRRVGFSLAANVLVSFADTLIGSDPEETECPLVDIESLRSMFLLHRNLAHGGETIELVMTGDQVGTLHVPGKGTIDIVGEHRLQILERLVSVHKRTGRPIKTADLTKGRDGQSLSNIFGKDAWEKLKAGFLRSPKKGLWEIAA